MLDWLDCMCNDIIILYTTTTTWDHPVTHDCVPFIECSKFVSMPWAFKHYQWQFCSLGYIVFNCMQIGFDAKNMKLTRKDRHNKSININSFFLNKRFFEDIRKFSVCDMRFRMRWYPLPWNKVNYRFWLYSFLIKNIVPYNGDIKKEHFQYNDHFTRLWNLQFDAGLPRYLCEYDNTLQKDETSWEREKVTV